MLISRKIIKKVIFDDYVLIGGDTTIAPGTIVGKDTLVGAISNSVYNQILEPGWVYFGIPIIKLKKLAALIQLGIKSDVKIYD